MAERFPCPECGEEIPTAAKKCRFCQHTITETERSAFKKATMRKAIAARRFNRADAPVTAEQRGLAIAALVVACIMALTVIPAFSLLGFHESRSYILGFVPLAIIAGSLGYAGRRSAMGVAAVALSVLAATESFAAFAYHHWQLREAEKARVEAERQYKEQQTRENAIANARRTAAEAEARVAEAKASVERAKADAARERDRLERERVAAQTAKEQTEQREKLDRQREADAAALDEERKKKQAESADRQAQTERKQKLDQKVRQVADLKQQIASVERKIENVKTNMPPPPSTPNASTRELLEHNRKILMQNVQNIQTSNTKGQYNDVLALEQAKLDKANRELDNLRRLDNTRDDRGPFEQQLKEYEQSRDALKAKLYEVAPELNPSKAALRKSIQSADGVEAKAPEPEPRSINSMDP
ncbi:MAG TPA: zinc ribbon domain-containing protein [Planctomycetota bacterium]|jgi:hypothetical protein